MVDVGISEMKHFFVLDYISKTEWGGVGDDTYPLLATKLEHSLVSADAQVQILSAWFGVETWLKNFLS